MLLSVVKSSSVRWWRPEDEDVVGWYSVLPVWYHMVMSDRWVSSSLGRVDGSGWWLLLSVMAFVDSSSSSLSYVLH